MKIRDLFVPVLGCGVALGFASASLAGPPPSGCPSGAQLEVNAFRGGSPVIKPPADKKLTAKARLVKGTVPGDTLCDGTITVTNDTTAEVLVVTTTFKPGGGGAGGNIFFDSSSGLGCPGTNENIVTFTATAESGTATPGVKTLTKRIKCPR